ncbi:hypothetical protein BVG16_06285 [Paenibacillus selenitireducens]|uniref:YitT family protein n=1 Tax=Paenibacillus selenitireducens TaxID=1324314 RepID=A0A1T2XLE3_9BACL|nr:YitT family protein [Paenibacillus selenitireducens]OPA80635.1 hypothetical protein BVG16_06285 [Paenibacillus selenitireducens]
MNVVLKKILAMVTGSMLLAIGINLFLIPYSVLDGGVIGIALIAKYLWGAKVGLTFILCSIPILILAWFQFRHFFFSSFPGMLISSYFIDLFSHLSFKLLTQLHILPIVSSFIGGIIMGVGFGIMLRNNISTGGTDLLAKFIADRLSVNVGFTIFILDGIIITLGGLLFSPRTFFLSILTITVGGIATGICCYRKGGGAHEVPAP